MCGIAGFHSWNPEKPAELPLLRSMLRAIRHRGPDDQGEHVSGATAIGARRLSVIDLEAGHQPLSDESGRYWIAYNGEVYNFRELRARLEKEGARFRTRTDTEVVVQWFRRFGAPGLKDLNGMFAFAIHDTKERALWLVRDRCGKKPLYYAEVPEGVVFASELHALLCHPCVGRGIDPVDLARYFAFDYVPAPGCLLKSARQLEPGAYLVAGGGKITRGRYWSLAPAAPERKPPDRWAAEIRETLQAAVRRRLVSDVPLGVFLSGGIDSSIVTALAAREVPPGSLKTFSVGFGESSFDERPYARLVSERFRTCHIEEVFTHNRAVEILPEVLGRLDEPFADSSLLPTYLLSKLARSQVTVALGGDGGDELFGGYPIFNAHRVARLLAGIVPRSVWKQIHPFTVMLPASSRYMSADFVVQRFLRGLSVAGRWRNQVWMGPLAPWDIPRMVRGVPPSLSEEVLFSGIREFQAQLPPGVDPVSRTMLETFRFFMTEDVLRKVDRASMQVSLEVRAPFLDDEMLDLAFSIPWSLKLKGRGGKYILKESMRDLLPPEILDRKKQGFAVPIAQWFRKDLRPLAQDVFSETTVRRTGLLHAPFVTRLWNEHQSGRRNHARPLWALFVFLMWHDRLRKC